MRFNYSLHGLILALTLSLGGMVEAQAPTASSQKDVTEVIINAQQKTSDWLRAESPHFIVFSDAKQQDVSQLLHKLERFDYLLRLYTKADTSAAGEQKTTLYYMARIRDLNQVDKNQPPYAIGLYNSCALGVQGFAAHMYYRVNPDRAIEKQPENEGLTYIFEAYARHFLYRYTSLRTPTWYIDGFAQYFASTRFTDTQTLMGIAPKSIGNYLAFMSNGHRRSLDYTDILLQNDSKGHNYAGTAGIQLEFQARSWILTHYILSSTETVQQFRQFIDLQWQGTEPTQAFEQAFGYKASQLNNVLWKYRLKTAKAFVFTLNEGDTSDIQFSSLPASANQLLLADAALKTCPTAKSGRALLDNVRHEAKKFPNSDFAQYTLSRAEIDWGNPQTAIAFLTAKTKAKDFDAYYLLGRAQLKLAEQSQAPEQQAYLDASQATLLQALAINPRSAEASFAYYKAAVQAQAAPSNETLGAAIIASQLQPEASAYLRAAALSRAYLKQVTEAEILLTVISHNSRDPAVAEWAKTWLVNLKGGVRRSQILAEMRQELAPVASFKEWTMANAEVMQEVELASGMESARSFLQDQQMQNQQEPDANSFNNN